MDSLTALLVFAFALLCSCGCMCALFAHVVGVLHLCTALLLFAMYFLGLVAGAVYFSGVRVLRNPDGVRVCNNS